MLQNKGDLKEAKRLLEEIINKFFYAYQNFILKESSNTREGNQWRLNYLLIRKIKSQSNVVLSISDMGSKKVAEKIFPSIKA